MGELETSATIYPLRETHGPELTRRRVFCTEGPGATAEEGTFVRFDLWNLPSAGPRGTPAVGGTWVTNDRLPPREA